MTISEIEKELKESALTKEERIKFIRKERARLMNEIHGKQQTLDRLDYMAREIKGD